MSSCVGVLGSPVRLQRQGLWFDTRQAARRDHKVVCSFPLIFSAFVCVVVQALKWGSLADWSLDMEHERNSRIRSCLKHYATELPLPTRSREAKHE